MSDVLYKNVDGVRIQMTAEEVTAHQKDEQDNTNNPKIKKMSLRSERESLLIEADYKINTLVVGVYINSAIFVFYFSFFYNSPIYVVNIITYFIVKRFCYYAYFSI